MICRREYDKEPAPEYWVIIQFLQPRDITKAYNLSGVTPPQADHNPPSAARARLLLLNRLTWCNC